MVYFPIPGTTTQADDTQSDQAHSLMSLMPSADLGINNLNSQTTTTITTTTTTTTSLPRRIAVIPPTVRHYSEQTPLEPNPPARQQDQFGIPLRKIKEEFSNGNNSTKFLPRDHIYSFEEKRIANQLRHRLVDDSSYVEPEPSTFRDCCSVHTDYTTTSFGVARLTPYVGHLLQQDQHKNQQATANRPIIYSKNHTTPPPTNQQRLNNSLNQQQRFMKAGTGSSDYLSVCSSESDAFSVRTDYPYSIYSGGTSTTYGDVNNQHRSGWQDNSERSLLHGSGERASFDGRGKQLLCRGNKWMRISILFYLISLACSGYVFLGFFGSQLLDQVALVQLPCDDLSTLYPLARSHKVKDEVTNEMFKDAGIQRFTREQEGVTYCRLPFTSVVKYFVSYYIKPVAGTFKLQVNGNETSGNHPWYTLDIISSSPLGTPTKSVIIPRNGVYMVFYNLKFSYATRINSCSKLPTKAGSSRIIRRSSSGEDVVLTETYHTCCATCKEEESITHFTGGLFQLSTNDRLSVQVSSPDSMTKRGRHFLAIFQIS